MLDPVIERKLPELVDIYRILRVFGSMARVDVVDEIEHRGLTFPIHRIALGSEDPAAPTLALIGGVHGLERIGAKVVIAYMETLARLLQWDSVARDRVESSRLVFVPLLNPVGTFLKRRSNGRGVDLMRNSPVKAKGWTHFPMGGHRVSPLLPFFRGYLQDDMEPESKVLVRVLKESVLTSDCAICVDLHSGFGAKDRLWVPYAKTKEPFPEYTEAFSLKKLLDASYPHHFYQFEPQAKQYTSNGDLWDYIYDNYYEQKKSKFFLPLTLEMGSWIWIKKNPRQILNILGPFNPILPHRRARILRRHITLFDFLQRAVMAPESWLTTAPRQREALSQEALKVWYAS